MSTPKTDQQLTSCHIETKQTTNNHVGGQNNASCQLNSQPGHFSVPVPFRFSNARFTDAGVAVIWAPQFFGPPSFLGPHGSKSLGTWAPHPHIPSDMGILWGPKTLAVWAPSDMGPLVFLDFLRVGTLSA